jgi:hypothetical protein
MWGRILTEVTEMKKVILVITAAALTLAALVMPAVASASGVLSSNLDPAPATPTPVVPGTTNSANWIQNWQQRFANRLGSSSTYKDATGAVVTAFSIPGTVAAISPTSITITPNDPQGRDGPFSIDGSTRIVAGPRGGTTDAIKVGDKVTVMVLGDSSHASAIRKEGPLAAALRSGRLNPLLGRLLHRLAPQRLAPGT